MTSCDLRLGTWQSELADVECDTLIVDAPYSARTHGGHDIAVTHGAADNVRKTKGGRRTLGYSYWDEWTVDRFVESWSPRCRGWMVSITDHLLGPHWAEAMQECGRYVFAPIPWVSVGSRVRLAGDGPSSWTCWIIVSRPRRREFMSWGTLPGAYFDQHDTASRKSPVVGAKPLALMRALVRDYSRPGSVICDPCSGGGTTARAAQIEGRSFIGAEMDPETHAKAIERLAQPFTAALFSEARPADTQGALL